MLNAITRLFQQQRRRQYPPPETLIRYPQANIWVEREADGTLIICRSSRSPTPARIYTGTHPEAIDRNTPLPFVPNQTQIRLTGLSPVKRHYFEIFFTHDHPSPRKQIVVAERFLPFECITNFRDIGGYLTQTGRRVRWGQVYRSGVLSDLTDHDRLYLLNLVPRLICDLRTENEAVQMPDELPEKLQTTYRHTPIYHRQQTLRSLITLIFKRHRFDQVMRSNYRRMVDERATVFGDLLWHIARVDNLPVILHCTAGKDRTGFAVALLLLILGVPEPVVIADYSLSNVYYAQFRQNIQTELNRLALLKLTIDDLQPILVADPATLQTTLAYIRDKYGSVRCYLHQAAGVDQQLIDRLKANLLE